MATRNPRRQIPVLRNQCRPVANWVGYINDFTVCPHNENHVMKHHKLVRHLIKCGKEVKVVTSHSGENETEDASESFETCPYNTLHRFRTGSRDNHFRECKSRATNILARMEAGELNGISDPDEKYAFKKDKKCQESHNNDMPK